MSEESVTEWIAQLKQGEGAAASKLWTRYVESLIRLAWQKLRDTPRRSADEDDVVQIAFDQFLRGVQTNRFRKLNDRNDLWQILVMLTDRRARDRRRRATVESKRLPLADHRESESGETVLGRLSSGKPSAEFAAEATEACRRLLFLLPDDEHRQIAIWKMEGYENREIAEKLGVVDRTVGRRLAEIRACWMKE
jgi:RNA polymerase sigma factor (sigma-70 family)